MCVRHTCVRQVVMLVQVRVCVFTYHAIFQRTSSSCAQNWKKKQTNKQQMFACCEKIESQRFSFPHSNKIQESLFLRPLNPVGNVAICILFLFFQARAYDGEYCLKRKYHKWFPFLRHSAIARATFFRWWISHFGMRTRQHDAHHVWQSPSGNAVRLFKKPLSHYCNVVWSVEQLVLLVHLCKPCLLWLLCIMSNLFLLIASLKKIRGPAQCNYDESAAYRIWCLFHTKKSVMAFYLSILQCKLKPCRKINRDCTSKRWQWQEMSVYSHIPLETINTAS